MPNRDKELVREYRSDSSTIFGMAVGDNLTIVQPTRIQQYEKVITEATVIFIDRNKMYKDAFTVMGLLGTATTLIGDIFRLKTMIYDSNDYGKQYKDQIRDKLLDVINQAIICIFVLDDDNYKGK